MMRMTRRQLVTRRIPQCLFSICFLMAVSWLFAQPAAAVDEGKTSHTAEAVCAFRAVGAQDPDPKTRNPDYMAIKFVHPVFKQHFPGLGLDFDDAKMAMDRMEIGVFYWVNARTLHLDTLLTRALKSGIRQVVIMGAGFDSRAYRYHEAYPDVRFYEIDLPATSRDKQTRVEKLLGLRPDWVTYVPIDFNTQTLDEVMDKAGFAADQKTFFIWEGVTYYISKVGVDNTLRYVAENAAPSSQIVFDYMLEEVVQGLDYSAYGARQATYAVAMQGEPYIFGIAPQRLEHFVNGRGLKLLSDLGPEELTRRYLIHSNGRPSGKIAGFLHIVHAEIPELQQQQKLVQRAGLQTESNQNAASPDAAHHKVDVPEDVQTLLDGFAQCMVDKDFGAMREHFSNKYTYGGAGREGALAFLQSTYRGRSIHQFKYVLTRFDRFGDTAKIDGFVQREGYREPIPLPALHLIKESDGRWRWCGDH